MPIPVTFSDDASVFEKSVPDSLRFAGWLLHRHDNLMRTKYSYDDNNEGAGVRIVEQKLQINRSDQRITVPQLLISTGFSSTRIELGTSRQLKMRVTLAAVHLMPYDTNPGETDTASGLTPHALLIRSAELFLRGTLYLNAWHAYINAEIPEDNNGMLVDPYHSPLFTEEDAPDPSLIGTYITDQVRLLNDQPPVCTMLEPDFWPRRTIKKGEDVDPRRDFAVAYGLKAEYEVWIPNRGAMSIGGSLA